MGSLQLRSRTRQVLHLCTAGVFCISALAAAAGAKPAAEAMADWPAALRDAFACEDASLWQGVRAVEEPRRQGQAALRWDTHTKNKSMVLEQSPIDLSGVNVLSFWLHAEASSPGTFMIIMESGRTPDSFSYYMAKVVVDWTGWKQVSLHFQQFSKARAPAGWQQIDRLRFSASGWNQDPSDKNIWTIDQIEFAYTDQPYRPKIAVKTYVAPPPREAFLQALRPGHPRLILLDEQLPKLQDFLANTPRGQEWLAQTRTTAESLYRRPVREHELPDGRRLLSISRDVLNRIYHWGLLYRLEKDPRYLERAYRELEAVVRFKDWNPRHYLDTAEMMHAVAVGYDWFYNDLSETQRSVLREGLWKHGLRLSHAAYMGLDAEGSQSWRHVHNNWNFVCNGGSSLAAMALLDEMPEACTDVLHAAFQYIQIPLPSFEPDGAWWEGVGYWGYSMRYFLAYLRGLETAFGGDFGFVESLRNTGFALAGDFPVYLDSPANGIFNFADSGSGTSRYQHWGLFFLAARFQNPLYLHVQEDNAKGSPDNIIYYEPFDSPLRIQDVALDKHFRDTDVASMRGSWTDRNALFVGIKCGRNGVAHAHQDLGSFAFYALGEKWIQDLGSERQTYLAHQHHLPKSRFYRIREEGHNTLVINPAEGFSQGARAQAPILRFASAPQECLAIADLSAAYAEHAATVTRGYRLFNLRRSFLVQDEISCKSNADLWWFAHAASFAEVELADTGRQATLRCNGKTCYVTLLAPAAARFTVMDAAPLPTSPNPDIQNQNKGIRKLAVNLPETRETTIAVLFEPAFDHEPQPQTSVALTPLADWQLPPASQTAPLDSIEIDGAALPDFSPQVFSYAIHRDMAPENLPRVTAQAQQGSEVHITPPTAFPGTARITVTHPNNPEPGVYAVRFLPPAPVGSAAKPHRASKPVTVGDILVTASHDDGNPPQNVLDGNPNTRWSASGDAEWIAFTFAQPRRISQVSIAWYNGDTRRATFSISISENGSEWSEVIAATSSGKTSAAEVYTLPEPCTVRALRITCKGNSSNLWNSMTEVGFGGTP